MKVSTLSKTNRPSGLPQAAEKESRTGDSLTDKVLVGARNTALSLIPGVGGLAGLRPMAFEMGISGDGEGAFKMDVATLANYASVPLLFSALAFPTVGLVGAGICLAASGAAGLWGSVRTA